MLRVVAQRVAKDLGRLCRITLFKQRAAERIAGFEMLGIDHEGLVAGLTGFREVTHLEPCHRHTGEHIGVIWTLPEVGPEVLDGVVVLASLVGHLPQMKFGD